jgi:hypothetical protein
MTVERESGIGQSAPVSSGLERRSLLRHVDDSVDGGGHTRHR